MATPDQRVITLPEVRMPLKKVRRRGVPSFGIGAMLDQGRTLIGDDDITEHAMSHVGTVDDLTNIFSQVGAFLGEPATAEFITDTFKIPGSTRPPLRIVPNILHRISDGKPREFGVVYSDWKASLYYVLENEHGPIANIGYNQFEDGVEIRHWQGVHASVIGRESVADLNRLGNWQEKLVSLVERYGIHHGLTYSLILPGADQYWVANGSFPLERAQKIYDEMAGNRDYDYNPDLRRFIKTLQISA